jgi:hypothetical protein
MATRKPKEEPTPVAPKRKAAAAKTVKATPAKKTVTKKPPVKSPKDIATEAKEPWVDVLSVELDQDNVGNGAFELDWNEYFVAKLVKAGYMRDKNDTDAMIVDRWFLEVCKNVVQENYEQWEANQPVDDRLRVINRRDIGDGRTEIS